MSASARFALLVTAVTLLAAAQPAGAQDAYQPDFRAAVKELLVIQKAADLVAEQMTYGMAEQLLQAMAAGGVQITEPMKQLVLDASRDEFGKKFSDVDYLTDLYVPIYAKHYSAQELQDMTAYWKSPVGQKTLKLMPDLTQETTSVLQQSSFALIPEFQKKAEARLRDAGVALPGAPSP